MRDFRPSIVAILFHPERAIQGTGFIVSGGVILTCAHVIESFYEPGRPVYFRVEGQETVQTAQVIHFSPAEELDIAFLQPAASMAEDAALPLCESTGSRGHAFSIFGYPRAGGFTGFNGAGQVMGHTRDENGRDVLQLDSRQITHGFSGAPVWDEVEQAVIGILQKGITDEEIGRPSFALPMEAARQAFPGLKVSPPSAPGPAAAASELRELEHALREKSRDLERLASQPLPAAGNPFLFIQPFGVADASRFFGREGAVRELLAQLETSHTTFLDGTGKTSALQAGVIPALLKEGHLPLMVRVSAEPLAMSLKKQLLPNIEAMDFLKSMSLAEFIHRSVEMLEGEAQLFVLVDGFEALFSQPESERERFREEWDLCVSGLAPRAHWLFSVPTHLKYLLGMFKDKAATNPNLVTLDLLEREQARQAMRGQAALRGIQIDEDVVEAVLDDLDTARPGENRAGGRIDPAQLQLVCYMLAGGKGTLVTHWDMAYYTAQGRAGGILRDYLDRTIGGFDPLEREPAWEVLAELVEEAGAIASDAALVQRMKRREVGEQVTRQVLLDLQSSHLVEYTEAYRLASDNLRPQIQAWRDKRLASEKVKEEVSRQVRSIRASALRGLLGGGLGFGLAYWVLPYIDRPPVTDPLFITAYVYNLFLRALLGGLAGFMMILGVDLALASFKGGQRGLRLPAAMLAGALSLAGALLLHTMLATFGEDLLASLGRAVLEGALWGAAAGAGALWAILSPRRLLSLLAGSLGCGLVLAASDAVLDGLGLDVPYPAFPIVFLAGTILPLFLTGSALLGRPAE